ncbi:MAG: ferredoxin [Spirulinaceae cyanobacterium]
MNEISTEPSESEKLSPLASEHSSLEQEIEELGLNKIERHIFLCADQTKPKCCPKKTSLEAWNYLKKRLRELGLEQPTEISDRCIFRTKANCLRVCTAGPILLVYPDGVWYRNATPKTIERILQEHILGNAIVEEYAFCSHPLENIAKKRNI